VERPIARARRLRPVALAGLLAILAACSNSESSTPAQTRAVTPVDLATAGSIRVVVSYTGTPPTPKLINMSGTPACAAAHPAAVSDQSLMVSGGRLANAVVYIKSGLGDRAFATPSDPVVIDQKGCLYDPHVVALMVGQPLRFRNSDQEAHNVHGHPKTVDAWNFLMSRPGSTRDVSFDKPEVGIAVACDVHPWMRAYVSVFDNPYFAVTPSDGTITLKAVPPGDYVVAAWHEALGTLVRPVRLAPSATADVEFTFQGANDAG
jgi:plastocyanin